MGSAHCKNIGRRTTPDSVKIVQKERIIHSGESGRSSSFGGSGGSNRQHCVQHITPGRAVIMENYTAETYSENIGRRTAPQAVRPVRHAERTVPFGAVIMQVALRPADKNIRRRCPPDAVQPVRVAAVHRRPGLAVIVDDRTVFAYRKNIR